MPGRDPALTAAPGARLAQLCTFRVGGEDYAIDIMRLREVIRPVPITPVPRAPPFVEGVFRVRGEVIPLLDVRKRFGLPASPPTRATRYLVVNVAGRRIGLLVDQVCEVVRVPRGEIRPAPELTGGGPRFFLGVCGGDPAPAGTGRRGPSRMRLLLNVKALLGPVTPGEIDAVREQAAASRGDA